MTLRNSTTVPSPAISEEQVDAGLYITADIQQAQDWATRASNERAVLHCNIHDIELAALKIIPLRAIEQSEQSRPAD